MPVSAYLAFVEGLLLLVLWLFSNVISTTVTGALEAPSSVELRAAIARAVPLAVAAIATSVVFARSALSVFTPDVVASELVRGLFVSFWLGLAILAVHATHSAVRVVNAYQRSARW